MNERKNELGTMVVTVRGQAENKKKELKRRFHKPTAPQLESALEKYCNNLPEVQETIVEMDERTSKIYQKIAIDNVRIHKDKGVKFFQFSGKFIFRDQESITTVDTENMEIETFDIEGTKYQYKQLHFSLSPARLSTVTDTKCYNNPIKHFVRTILSENLVADDYQIEEEEQLYDNINVVLKGDAKKNYQQVLRENFEKIDAFGLTFGRRSKKLISSEESQEEVNDLFASLLGQIVGVDVEEEESPFESMQVRCKFKKAPYGHAADYRAYKRTLKNKLVQLDKNQQLREGKIEYFDDDDALQVAVRRGCVKAAIVELESDLWGDDEKMWDEQISFFHEHI